MRNADKIKLILAILVVMALLSACSGVMKGMIQEGGELVNFQFEDTGFGYGKIRTTLPDGENFEGKFVEESTSGYASGSGTVRSGTQTSYVSTYESVSTYSGNVEAVLFGNKGHTMRCKFRTADSIGLPSGGVGMCQVSDGRVIDVQF